MDADRFDALSRTLTKSGSRRATLRALLGTLFGRALLDPSADALGKGHGKKPRKDSRRKHDDHQPGERKHGTGRGRDHDPARNSGRERTALREQRSDAVQLPLAPESGRVASDEVTAADHGCTHAGENCTDGEECCTGRCLKKRDLLVQQNQPLPPASRAVQEGGLQRSEPLRHQEQGQGQQLPRRWRPLHERYLRRQRRVHPSAEAERDRVWGREGLPRGTVRLILGLHAELREQAVRARRLRRRVSAGVPHLCARTCNEQEGQCVGCIGGTRTVRIRVRARSRRCNGTTCDPETKPKFALGASGSRGGSGVCNNGVCAECVAASDCTATAPQNGFATCSQGRVTQALHQHFSPHLWVRRRRLSGVLCRRPQSLRQH